MITPILTPSAGLPGLRYTARCLQPADMLEEGIDYETATVQLIAFRAEDVDTIRSIPAPGCALERFGYTPATITLITLSKSGEPLFILDEIFNVLRVMGAQELFPYCPN